MTIIIIKITIIVMVIMIIKIPVGHLKLTYQVLSSFIFEALGTQSLHFKCPALAVLIFKVPGIQNLCVWWPGLAALIFEVPGIQNLNFKCPAAGHKVTPIVACDMDTYFENIQTMLIFLKYYYCVSHLKYYKIFFS